MRRLRTVGVALAAAAALASCTGPSRGPAPRRSAPSSPAVVPIPARPFPIAENERPGTSSGAGVFASGTMRWVCAMRGPSCGHGLTWAAQRFVDRATQNLLRAFAAGPAGRTHPAHDNLGQVKPPRIPGLYDGVD